MSNLPTWKELQNMKPCGFWDRSFFRGIKYDSGIILRNSNGREIRLSYAEIKKIKEESKNG